MILNAELRYVGKNYRQQALKHLESHREQGVRDELVRACRLLKQAVRYQDASACFELAKILAIGNDVIPADKKAACELMIAAGSSPEPEIKARKEAAYFISMNGGTLEQLYVAMGWLGVFAASGDAKAVRAYLTLALNYFPKSSDYLHRCAQYVEAMDGSFDHERMTIARKLQDNCNPVCH